MFTSALLLYGVPVRQHLFDKARQQLPFRKLAIPTEINNWTKCIASKPGFEASLLRYVLGLG